jgi:hypothetical protein
MWPNEKPPWLHHLVSRPVVMRATVPTASQAMHAPAERKLSAITGSIQSGAGAIHGEERLDSRQAKDAMKATVLIAATAPARRIAPLVPTLRHQAMISRPPVADRRVEDNVGAARLRLKSDRADGVPLSRPGMSRRAERIAVRLAGKAWPAPSA